MPPTFNVTGLIFRYGYIFSEMYRPMITRQEVECIYEDRFTTFPFLISLYRYVKFKIASPSIFLFFTTYAPVNIEYNKGYIQQVQSLIGKTLERNIHMFLSQTISRIPKCILECCRIIDVYSS